MRNIEVYLHTCIHNFFILISILDSRLKKLLTDAYREGPVHDARNYAYLIYERPLIARIAKVKNEY